MSGVIVCEVAVTSTLLGNVVDDVREFPDCESIESLLGDVLDSVVMYFVDGATVKVKGIIFDLFVVEDF